MIEKLRLKNKRVESIDLQLYFRYCYKYLNNKLVLCH